MASGGTAMAGGGVTAGDGDATAGCDDATTGGLVVVHELVVPGLLDFPSPFLENEKESVN